jgi:hypothetical protein
MRVFHFVNHEFGLEDIRERRLKVAMLHELNDPFEFFGLNLSDKTVRKRVRAAKDEFAARYGLLCFSRNWINPVQWSHYAAKHSGLCLGFDVPDRELHRITYSPARLVVDTQNLLERDTLGDDIITKCLLTKYVHWRYENEVRKFVPLEETTTDGRLRFVSFSPSLRLTCVIVGHQSAVTKAELRSTLGTLAPEVGVWKARAAFSKFCVVKQLDGRLWT